MKKLLTRISIIALVGFIFISPNFLYSKPNKAQGKNNMEKEFDQFVNEYYSVMKPTYTAMSLAYFTASVNNTPENWKKSAENEMQMNAFLSDKARFARLKTIKDAGKLSDPLKQRQLDVMYLEFLSKQVDTTLLNQLTKMQTDLEGKYSGFRAVVGDKKYTDNDVEDILKNSTDNKELENVWVAQKKIGPLVAQDIINIVKKRNQMAKELGFKNFHDMSLRLSEEDPEAIEKLFDELDHLTRSAFLKEKSKMDDILAKRLGIQAKDLMPWDYQNRFFQEAPQIYNVDLDAYFKNVDVVKKTVQFYKSIGLEIQDMVDKSDLFEKPGKNQHAYCINIDKDAKDTRVLANVKPNNRWMETLMHEFGHACYEKYYDESLPWNLKNAAQIFTTEGLAMMFGRFATNPNWMKDMINLPDSEKNKIYDDCFKTLRLQQLVFSRWAQVMYRFEKSMYENPDQDLNKLWWDLVEKYQGLKKPEGRNMPDWATKIHIATSPCYYHNYLLGELFASQFYYTICEKVLKVDPKTNPSFVGRPEVGKFLIKNLFGPGQKYYWNDMIKKATGSYLTPKFYAQQFVN